MTIRYYAGIGSRRTPPEVCAELTWLAAEINRRFGFRLRSGGARGADQAFAAGSPRSWIARPETVTDAALEIAAEHHPAWGRCDDRARSLLGRNAQIILGPGLDDPVLFAVAWTEAPHGRGGTNHALRIAWEHGIEIFNLARSDITASDVLEWADYIHRNLPENEPDSFAAPW